MGEPAAPLAIETKYLDFGDVGVHDRFRHVVPIRNRAAKEVRVLDIVASCSCVDTSPRQFSIAPGQTVNVTLVVNLRFGEPRRVQLPERDFSTRFKAVTDDKTARTTCSLSGTGMTPYAIEPSTHDWGSIIKEEAVTPLSVSSRSGVPLHGLDTGTRMDATGLSRGGSRSPLQPVRNTTPGRP
ncbi:MAG: DUF1573 domain-containing protein [Planctomycetota bacterium]